MNLHKVPKRSRKRKEKRVENPEEELNIRYHDFNPEWNYTISPRTKTGK